MEALVIKNDESNNEHVKYGNITKSNKEIEVFEPFKMEVTCEDEEGKVNDFHKKKKSLKPLYKISIKTESSEDDVPLSNFKIGKCVAIPDFIDNLKSDQIKVLDQDFVEVKVEKLNESGLSKQERREKRRFKREQKVCKILRNSKLTILPRKQGKIKKKSYEYKNGKKVFCKSGKKIQIYWLNYVVVMQPKLTQAQCSHRCIG